MSFQFLQGYPIYLTERSVNAKKEFDNYTWQQDKDGKWQNIPVDDYNHIIDPVRYVCQMELMGRKDKERTQQGDIAAAFAR